MLKKSTILWVIAVSIIFILYHTLPGFSAHEQMKPKFQSDMQFASHLPVCSTVEGLPSSDSSKTGLQNNNDQIQIHRPGYNSLSSLCNTIQLQDHEKEEIKKIMLQQDATFKHQVSELHRVYRTQKEMMGEIKMGGPCTDNIEGTASKSNPIMFGGPSKSDQTYHASSFTSVDPSCHWPSSTFNFQVASNLNPAKSMQAPTNTSIIASSLKETELLPSSSKEFRKRTFDLELPADNYIDCEEERFEDGTVLGSKARDCAVKDLSKDLSATCHQKDLLLSICKDQLNPSEGNSSGTNLIPSIINLADMNKTFELEKEGTLYSTSFLPVDTSNMSNMERPHLELSYSQKPKTVFQVQTKDTDYTQIGKDLEKASTQIGKDLEKASTQHVQASPNHLISAIKPFDASVSVGSFCLNNNVDLSRNLTYDSRFLNVGSLQNNFLQRLPAKDVDSSSMYSSHMSNLTNFTHGNEKLDSTIQGLNWLGGNLAPGGISDKVREGSLSHGLGLRLPKEFLMSNSNVEPKWHGTSHILNYRSIHGSSGDSQIINDQFSKSHPNLSEVKVADNYENIGILDRRSAHAFPVTKRNWSAQSEMLKNGVYRKCKIDLNSSLNEVGTEQVEVEVEMKNAADINLEPPVSPENKESSLPRGNLMEKKPTDSVELTKQDDKSHKDLDVVAAEALVIISSNSDRRLEWFAGIVSSPAANVSEENGTVQGHLAVKPDSNHSGLIADGLNNFAAQTPRMEDIKFEEYSSNSTGHKKRAGPATSSSLPKRKRTRRTRSQKAMPGNILPRITSPSRKEVSEEIDTISGMRENEGKAKRKKKLSKNERQRGKKHNRKSNVLQHPTCSYKQQTNDTELDSLERCLPGWGRKHNRQAGRRRPAPNRAYRF